MHNLAEGMRDAKVKNMVEKHTPDALLPIRRENT